jgi:hypothetical protein
MRLLRHPRDSPSALPSSSQLEPALAKLFHSYLSPQPDQPRQEQPAAQPSCFQVIFRNRKKVHMNGCGIVIAFLCKEVPRWGIVGFLEKF